MPNTKIGRKGLKDFFYYHKGIYLVLILVTWLVGDVIYSATTYRSPDERSVQIMAVSTTVDLESTLPLLSEELLKKGQAFDETLEEVVFQRIAYNPASDTDGFGGQQYLLMVGAGEGDIYMLPRTLMHVLVNEGYLLPLEGYIDAGLIDPAGLDLESVTFAEPVDEEEDYDPTVRHVYAIPMDGMNKMLTSGITFDNRDAYMVLMGFSGNPDTSACVMGQLLTAMTGERPDWAQIQPTHGSGNVFDDVLQDAGYAPAE